MKELFSRGVGAVLSAFRLRWRDGDRVTIFSGGAGSSALSSLHELFELARQRWGAPPRHPGWSSARRVKLVEYGEDAGAHDRRALESRGGAEHEGDENTLHIYMCWGALRTWRKSQST